MKQTKRNLQKYHPPSTSFMCMFDALSQNKVHYERRRLCSVGIYLLVSLLLSVFSYRKNTPKVSIFAQNRFNSFRQETEYKTPLFEKQIYKSNTRWQPLLIEPTVYQPFRDKKNCNFFSRCYNLFIYSIRRSVEIIML